MEKQWLQSLPPVVRLVEVKVRFIGTVPGESISQVGFEFEDGELMTGVHLGLLGVKAPPRATASAHNVLLLCRESAFSTLHYVLLEICSFFPLI